MICKKTLFGPFCLVTSFEIKETNLHLKSSMEICQATHFQVLTRHHEFLFLDLAAVNFQMNLLLKFFHQVSNFQHESLKLQVLCN